jgi:hypothetical protein
MVTDEASRYGFKYVSDRVTKRWVYREFEIRVDTARPLPVDTGSNIISLQLFRPTTAQSGGLYSGTPALDGVHRVWRGADVSDEDDLRGESGYGITVSWPQEGKETRYDTMEMFPLPAFDSIPPETWSPWATAASMRAGAFGWWEEVQGIPADSVPPPPKYPFELRWRLILTDQPGVIP